MQLQIDKLGKVAITIEKAYWSATKDYDKLTVVEVEGQYKTFVSRKPVPAGTSVTDRNYWIPFSSLKEEIVIAYNKWVNTYGGLLTSLVTVLNGVQTEVNDLYTHMAKGITFSGDKEVFEHGTTDEVTLSFYSVNRTPVTCKLYKNNVLVKTYSNVTEWTEAYEVDSDTEFKVEADQGGYTYTASWNVGSQYPFYGGSGNTYTDVVNAEHKLGAKYDISGLYTIEVTENGQSFFFVVPNNTTIVTMKMNGLEVPCKEVTEQTVDGIIYKVYESANTYVEGTYLININGYATTEAELVDILFDRVDKLDEEALEFKRYMANPPVDNETISVNEDSKIALADKTYNPEEFSGLGRVYLKKNVKSMTRPFDGTRNAVTVQSSSATGVPDHIWFDETNHRFVAQFDTKYYASWSDSNAKFYMNPGNYHSVYQDNDGFYVWDATTSLLTSEGAGLKIGNVLTQDMISEANTIYHIQYDFHLNEETITIPEGCVLEFEGGSLKDGTLVGNGTAIKGTMLFDTITFNGSYAIDSIRISQVIGYSSDYVRLNKFFDLAIRRSNCKDIYLEGEEFTIEYPLTTAINFGTFFNFEDVHEKYIHGEGAYLKDITNLNINPIVRGTQSVFCFQYCTNITIDDIKYEAVNFVPYFESDSTYLSTDRFDFIQLRGDCSYITLRGEINNARTGIMCNPFIDFGKPTRDKIGSHHIDVDIVSDWTAYPVAFNWGSNVKAKINCSNQHRAAYLCGVNSADIDVTARTRNVAGTGVMCLISDGCLPLNNEVESTADNRLCRHSSNVFVNFMLDNTNGNAIEGVIYQNPCYCIGFQWYNIFIWRTNPEICSNIKINIDGRGSNSNIRSCAFIHTNTLEHHIDGDCCSDMHFVLHKAMGDTILVGLQNFVKNLIFEYDYKRPSAAIALTYTNSYSDNNIIVKGLRNAVVYLDGFLFVENSELVEVYSRGSTSNGRCVVIADEKSTIGTLKPADTYCPINVYQPSGTSARMPKVLPVFFVGKKYFNTSFGRSLYVKAVNSTTGAVTWVDEKGYTAARNNGTTEQRPTDTLTTSDAGFQYFDTTLGMPIYLKVTGSTKSWVKADGTDA